MRDPVYADGFVLKLFLFWSFFFLFSGLSLVFFLFCFSCLFFFFLSQSSRPVVKGTTQILVVVKWNGMIMMMMMMRLMMDHGFLLGVRPSGEAMSGLSVISCPCKKKNCISYTYVHGYNNHTTRYTSHTD